MKGGWLLGKKPQEAWEAAEEHSSKKPSLNWLHGFAIYPCDQ